MAVRKSPVDSTKSNGCVSGHDLVRSSAVMHRTVAACSGALNKVKLAAPGTPGCVFCSVQMRMVTLLCP